MLPSKKPPRDGSKSAPASRSQTPASFSASSHPPSKRKTFSNGGPPFVAPPRVDEAYKIVISKRIEEFAQGSEKTIEFPSSLTSDERKHVHFVCHTLGFISKSYGKGAARALRVSKPKARSQTPAQLTVNEETKRLLNTYFSKRPVLDWESEFVQGRRNIIGKGSATFTRHNERPTNAPSNAGSKSGKKSMGILARFDVDFEPAKAKPEAEGQKPPPLPTPPISKERQALPIFNHREEIVHALVKNPDANPVTVLSGETGSGKSTQVVQYIIDADPNAKVICTQPRRISAIALAQRVSEERHEPQLEGQDGAVLDRSVVGFSVRLESKRGPNTRIMFCTTGVVLASMRSSTYNANSMLNGVTHLLLDEVHERDLQTDFLLILAREICRKPGNTLKIVVMSATLNVDSFIRYFGKDLCNQHIQVMGSLFPVRQMFLEHALVETDYCSSVLGLLKRTPQIASDGKSLTKVTGTKPADKLRCSKCGSAAFASASEFGLHIVTCAGLEQGKDVASRLESLSLTPKKASGWDDEDEEEEEVDESLLAQDEEEDAETEAPELPEDRDFSETNLKDALASYQETRFGTDDEDIDFRLIVALLERIHATTDVTKSSTNAVLIFLPGWREISELCELLGAHPVFGNPNTAMVLPLHSGIPLADQKRVFTNPPNSRIRKIVVSTNIAETSVTINDIAYVIDAGLAKEKTYDAASRISSLLPRFISKASIKQRKGRAGRCRPGVSYHLMSSARYHALEECSKPEILRSQLEGTCLHAKIIVPEYPLHDFFGLALDVPNPKVVRDAIQSLIGLGALNLDESVTQLGRILGSLPLEPKTAKMLLMGRLLRAPWTAGLLSVASEARDVFYMPINPVDSKLARQVRTGLSAKFEPQIGRSDHVATLAGVWAFETYGAEERRTVSEMKRFCAESYMAYNAVQGMLRSRSLLFDRVRGWRDVRWLRGGAASGEERERCHPGTLVALVTASSFPNVAVYRDARLSSGNQPKITPHFSSSVQLKELPQGEVSYFAFGELVRGSKTCTMHRATRVPGVCLSLFAGGFFPTPVAEGEDEDEQDTSFRLSFEDDEEDEEDQAQANGREEVEQRDEEEEEEDEIFVQGGRAAQSVLRAQARRGTAVLRVFPWLRLATRDRDTALKLVVLRLRWEKALLDVVQVAGTIVPPEIQYVADVVASILRSETAGPGALEDLDAFEVPVPGVQRAASAELEGEPATSTPRRAVSATASRTSRASPANPKPAPSAAKPSSSSSKPKPAEHAPKPATTGKKASAKPGKTAAVVTSILQPSSSKSA